MACFTASLGVIFLLGFIDITAAKDTCEFYAALGQQSLTLPFVYEKLINSHLMKWTHNTTIIFYREQGKVSVGKLQDISATGSLFLKNLLFSSAGTYQAQVLYPNGTLAKMWTGHLCMMDKVSKPQLSYGCDFKFSAVNLNCDVVKPQGLVFSWTLDGKTLTSETKQTLRISLTQLKGEVSFTCSAANKASKEISDIVRPTCKTPPAAMLCFTHQTVVAVLAGAAALILLLLIITMVLCCRHRRNKTHMRHRNKGELRMLSVNKQDPDSISPEYETMHPTESSPALSPQPSPRACYQKVPQPEVQSENRSQLPQLPTAAEGQKPSPVPKPRMRNPQTTNM